jgi:hypothetical protein
VKFITIETRSKLLPTLTIDRPFASDAPGGPNTGEKPTIETVGGKPGALQDLRPKVTAFGYDSKPVLTWAPYGEPGKKTVGEPEGKAIGGALLGFGAVFGLGWWLGGRRARRKALRARLTAKR